MLPPDEKNRVRLSAGLYDATLVALHRLWVNRDDFIKNKADIKRRLRSEIAHPSNGPVITGQANTSQAVRDRITLVQRVLTGEAG